jgi:hypothetical protein
VINSPRLRHRAWQFTDHWSDSLLNRRPEADAGITWAYWTTQRIMCTLLGHIPVRDNCGIPEHDCCGYCMASTPGKARR